MLVFQNAPSCDKSECFACHAGKCIALTDNKFGDKDCPFYKTWARINLEERERKLRLEKLEMGLL